MTNFLRKLITLSNKDKEKTNATLKISYNKKR